MLNNEISGECPYCKSFAFIYKKINTKCILSFRTNRPGQIKQRNPDQSLIRVYTVCKSQVTFHRVYNGLAYYMERCLFMSKYFSKYGF